MCECCGKVGPASSILRHQKVCVGRSHLVQGTAPVQENRCSSLILYVFAASMPDPGYGECYTDISSRLYANSNSPYSTLILAVNNVADLKLALGSLRPQQPCCLVFYYHGLQGQGALQIGPDVVSVAQITQDIEAFPDLRDQVKLVHYSACYVGGDIQELDAVIPLSGFTGPITLENASAYDYIIFSSLAWFGYSSATFEYISILLDVYLTTESTTTSVTRFFHSATEDQGEDWPLPPFQLPLSLRPMDPMLEGMARMHTNTRDLVPGQAPLRTSSRHSGRRMKHERSRGANRENRHATTSTRDAANTPLSGEQLGMEVSSTSVVDLTADSEDEEIRPGKY